MHRLEYNPLCGLSQPRFGVSLFELGLGHGVFSLLSTIQLYGKISSYCEKTETIRARQSCGEVVFGCGKGKGEVFLLLSDSEGGDWSTRTRLTYALRVVYTVRFQIRRLSVYGGASPESLLR
jgi:hypothetical protein